MQVLRSKTGIVSAAEVAASGGPICTIAAHSTDIDRLKAKVAKLTAENKEVKDTLTRYTAAAAVCGAIPCERTVVLPAHTIVLCAAAR